MPERRALSFQTLDQIMPEVDHLQAGYAKAGQWTLSQACSHLADTFKGSMQGFPIIPQPFRTVMGVLRPLVGKKFKTQVLTSGTMKSGIKVPAKFLPKTGLDDRAEAEALRGALHVYNTYNGPMAPHPMFGAMTRADWDRLHLIHAAHHLGFLVPGAVHAAV